MDAQRIHTGKALKSMSMPMGDGLAERRDAGKNPSRGEED